MKDLNGIKDLRCILFVEFENEFSIQFRIESDRDDSHDVFPCSLRKLSKRSYNKV